MIYLNETQLNELRGEIRSQMDWLKTELIEYIKIRFEELENRVKQRIKESRFAVGTNVFALTPTGIINAKITFISYDENGQPIYLLENIKTPIQQVFLTKEELVLSISKNDNDDDFVC